MTYPFAPGPLVSPQPRLRARHRTPRTRALTLLCSLALAGLTTATSSCGDAFTSCEAQRNCPSSGAAGEDASTAGARTNEEFDGGGPGVGGTSSIEAQAGAQSDDEPESTTTGGRSSVVDPPNASGTGGDYATEGGDTQTDGAGGDGNDDASHGGSSGNDENRGGASSLGGAPGAPRTCLIGEVTYPEDNPSPSNACAVCSPEKSTMSWSLLSNGASCGTGQVCRSGVCTSGCWIDSSLVSPGTANPENPCLSCDPAKSASGWSDTPTAKCVQAIAAGLWQTCAVVNGAAFCWGANNVGQLGNDSTNESLLPVQVSGLTTGVTSVTASTSTCAVVNGSARCWGLNGDHGMLGDGTTETRLSPVQVSGLTSGVTSVAAGGHHVCAVRGGAALCWGENLQGQVGSASIGDSVSRPEQVSGLTSGVSSVSGNSFHTCAVVNGAVRCWGSGNFGALGNGTTEDSRVPVQVSGLTSNVTAISAGYAFTCAIVNGSVRCWGLNFAGQLGNNSLDDATVPTQVAGLTSGVTAISAGAGHACAIVNGSARCWGNGYSGQLGNNSSENNSALPVQVSGLSSGVTAIAAGDTHTCALMHGSAYCWGDNSNGRLGNNSTTRSLVPVKVMLP